MNNYPRFLLVEYGVIILTGIVVCTVAHVLINRAAGKEPRTIDGWRALEHPKTIWLAPAGAMALGLIATDLVMLIMRDRLGTGLMHLLSLSLERSLPNAAGMALVFALPCGVFSTYVIEFNETHIRRRWLGLVKEWPWSDAAQLGNSFGWPTLQFRSGDRIFVSNLAVGHRALIDELRRRGVHIRDHVQLPED